MEAVPICLVFKIVPGGGAVAPFSGGFVDLPGVRRYDEHACLRPLKKGDRRAYKENSRSACTEEIGWTNHSSVDEEEEYRCFGGYLPAVKPGRYILHLKQLSDWLDNGVDGLNRSVCERLQTLILTYRKMEEFIYVWNCRVYWRK